jgi:hypothetical protein
MSIEHLACALNNLDEIVLSILVLLGSFLPLVIYAATARRKHRQRSQQITGPLPP